MVGRGPERLSMLAATLLCAVHGCLSLPMGAWISGASAERSNPKKVAASVVGAFLAVIMMPAPAHAVSLIEDAWFDLVVTTGRGDSVHVSSDGNRLTRVSLVFDGEEFCLDVAPYAQLEGPYVQSLELLVDQGEAADGLTRKLVVPFYSWKGVRHNGLALVVTFKGARLVEARVTANHNFDDVIHVFTGGSGAGFSVAAMMLIAFEGSAQDIHASREVIQNQLLAIELTYERLSADNIKNARENSGHRPASWTADNPVHQLGSIV